MKRPEDATLSREEGEALSERWERDALTAEDRRVLGHWATLTRFLTGPGAPLDNNVAERALKLCIRQRKNSLVSATEQRAYGASLLTSVIATCLQAGGNALEYLVAVQEPRQAVFANPAAWLPWPYAAAGAPP
jgi:transposase